MFIRIWTKCFLEYPKIFIYYPLHVAHYGHVMLQHEQHYYEGLFIKVYYMNVLLEHFENYVPINSECSIRGY